MHTEGLPHRGPLLDGKVAIVTGVSPNIMGGIAECLAAEGAAVAAIDVREEYATACARYLNACGRSALGLQCDVTVESAVHACVQRVIDEFGRVDILVNGAAIQIQKGILEASEAEWSRQLAVILTGAFHFTRAVASHMVRTSIRGSIINIISTEGHQGVPDNIAYSTAKGGLLQFTRSAAMDLARHGIRVNSVSPTSTDPAEALERATRWGVKWHSAMVPPGEIVSPRPAWRPQDRWRLIPLGRLPRPSDYAAAVVFLASDKASMITGVDLRVDGGAVSKYWQWVPWPEVLGGQRLLRLGE
jgi:NAD(P)-dependent dehydrogenase (short-subunit alcohol dehydrogenase family)